MEVILKQDIPNVGNRNEIVTIKAGYGRNFLIPNGMAVLATAVAKKNLEEVLKQSRHKEAENRAQAEEMVEKLQGVTLSITAKASESGKIFGSVTNVQIAQALKDNRFDIERKQIFLKESVKQLGTHTCTVTLFKDIQATISFEVIAAD